MAAFIRLCSRRLLSDGCRIGSSTVSEKTKCLFRDIWCQSRPHARAIHSVSKGSRSNNKSPIVSTVFIRDDDEVKRCLVKAQFIGNEKENLKRIQTEIGADVNLQMNPRHMHPRVVGSDLEKVNRAVEIVLEEVQRLRDLLEKENLIKEKLFTDKDVKMHLKICDLLFGKRRNTNMFTSATGMKLEVIAMEEQYIFITGNDAEVVGKAAKVVNQQISKIRKIIDSESDN